MDRTQDADDPHARVGDKMAGASAHDGESDAPARAQELLIERIQTALSGGEARAVDASDLSALYALSKAHGLHVLIFDRVRMDGVPSSIVDAWTNDIRQNFMHDLLQRRQHALIISALREAGIRFLALKGIALKELYPQSCHRVMADLDYFLPDWNQEDVTKVMETLGFEVSGGEPCHLHFTNQNGLHVEMHRTLVPSKHPLKPFSDFLERAVREENAELAWSREDEYLYLLLHVAKHITASGIGVRQMLDLYLFQERYAPDVGYIRETLTRFGLFPFYQNIQALISRWFSRSGAQDEQTDEMARFVFASGSYGTKELRTRRMFREKLGGRNNRALYLLMRMFPNLDHMRPLYPALEKRWFLLPFIWVWRLCSLSVRHRDTLRREMRALFLEDTRQWKAVDRFFR